MSDTCFHCGLPVPQGEARFVRVDGDERPMCCAGCQAVAQAIVEAGMEDYYRFRTEAAPRGAALVPAELSKLKAYDNPAIQERFVREAGENLREAVLILEGITCAACVWLNEQHIASLPGVFDVSINYSTRRARVRWDDSQTQLSSILEAISRIGYLAHPYDPDRQDAVLAAERRDYLRRIGVTGLLGMQIMIIAVALYAGDWWGMDPAIRTFFRWLGLGLTAPILLYGAKPFFQAAWRDLKRRRVGMDVPVSLGMSIAYVASVHATVINSGEVYFDSVAMFTFFLLTARFLEMAARKRAAEAMDSIARLQPAVATRLVGEGTERREQPVAAADLVVGDLIALRPGEQAPADGVVEEGQSSLDESLLTGESMPVRRVKGDPVIGGSTNVESPLVVRVDRVGPETVLAGILDLLDRAQAEKPGVALLADRIAGRFVAVLLTLAAVVAAWWYMRGSSAWLPITISLLVVTCPCALSLATPAAVTAAMGHLARLGVVSTRGHALETLTHVSDFVFDKTGTLTEGRPALLRCLPAEGYGKMEVLRFAAALERHSEHPLGAAIRAASGDGVPPEVVDLENVPGAGVTGLIDGARWRVGTLEFCLQREPEENAAIHPEESAGETLVFVSRDDQLVATLAMGDTLRAGARILVNHLKSEGVRVHLFTGDRDAPAQHVAHQVGIDDVRAGLTPEEKLEGVRAIQSAGGVVAMVGDGINDAPVLAGADVSVAVGSGTHLATASADMVLMSDRLEHLVDATGIARRGVRVIRQNLFWALAYNATAIPAAAVGWVQPWMAAIGMSLSSLLVVLNALRLTR
ncbi:MAG: heavy metal translocating P-type ATPase [Gammaproteobacteria bacterium]